MLPQVIPILSTAVDHAKLFVVAKQYLGRSLTQQLDGAGVSASGHAGFIASLAEMREPGERPSAILEDAGPLLRHSHFGFLVVASSRAIFEIMESSQLAVLTAPTPMGDTRIAVITGTLLEWRDAVLAGCSGKCGMEFRVVACKCLLCFEQVGLGKVWAGFDKRMQSDSTFTLLERR